ncbi:MAG: hypothetical protein KAQ96_11990, partial [Thermoplasmata archaeon]|nr:hypothetical protein [Thermoplasmata archaeon]
DVSIIESGEFTIDMEPPSISILTGDEAMTEGEEFLIVASVDDDLQVLSALLHVSGEDVDREYSMTEGADGMWAYPYIPLEDDENIWVTASDGAHEATSGSLEIDVKKATAGGSAQSSLALELVIAAGLAAVLLLVVVLIRKRT